MPPGYSSRDDRCGTVRVAAERHVCDKVHLPKFDPIQGRELRGLPSFLWGVADRWAS
jgi:hypothetical protein